MGQASKNFLVEEFVPQKIYEKYGDASLWFVDPKIVKIAQLIRDYFGKSMTINNWHNGMLIYQPIHPKERVNFLNIVWVERLISISQE